MILDEILNILKKKNNSNCYSLNGEIYRYKDFYKFVCNIYHYLILENPLKKTIVVYGHKDVYMKATFLACSFAGITYVPIDENIPSERIKVIINQVNPIYIIGDFKTDNIKSISKKQIINIMKFQNYNDIEQIYLKPNDIYYIIFTSGSTGVPKGVKVTYSNLNSCINWLRDITKIEKGVIINQANFSFDLSVADLYLSLVTESEHYILEKNIQSNFKLLFEELKNSQATMMVATPSFADLLLLDKSFNEELMPNLKTILFCGEKLTSTTIKKIYDRFNNIKIINSYGPTECTFAVTSIEITKSMINQKNISIGRPKQDVKVMIVDDNLKELEDGEIGEILIAGESVTDGYINTKSNNFIMYHNMKAYLTGDLGYYLDGNLYYVDRKDRQIKYKGYRIELNDIEKNLYNLEYIEKALVCIKKNKDGKVQRLFAFVTLKENANKTENDIRKDLHIKLPEYMCPNIKIIKSFPLNQNGKCNEKRLLEELQ